LTVSYQINDAIKLKHMENINLQLYLGSWVTIAVGVYSLFEKTFSVLEGETNKAITNWLLNIK